MRSLINSFLDRLSALLLVFGTGLLIVGLVVHLSRIREMQQVTHAQASIPRFEDTLRMAQAKAQGRQIAPAMSPEPSPASVQVAPPKRIVIPSITVDTPVVEVGWEARVVNGENQGNVWQTADYAAGHHQFSSSPGEVGNMVISGHNNIRGAVFRDLYKLVPGDLIQIYDADGKQFSYQVAESFVVPEENATPAERADNTHWIRQTADERLTLITCFPPWSNTHRAIVVAFPYHAPAPTGTAAAGLQ